MSYDERRPPLASTSMWLTLVDARGGGVSVGWAIGSMHLEEYSLVRPQQLDTVQQTRKVRRQCGPVLLQR